ncbi:citrate synthase [Leptospira biflexa]|jgi:citrate synthase|uniref:Citrate synthase n=2 Tax=Leptospira TaxID=171 RepID=B0SMX9_LEPBP|nr:MULTISPECIES: citrate synthase [Leptospira]PKA24923.1 citrate (Si)-synthase [Leptospira sp. mixed culture ATI2-C-A1]ABZ93536.1 Citrate (Si)-synthase [Leptospira biflexa serovar Patoc strain 'Patoc 1 (Ames)']ABZ97166.1 Citrate synthase [Leptospira biflexa serovar Patoc strain 'Patoc 1 (Paris)']MCG6148267.1 citrate synthase [Leptospira levettii]MCW7473297.1 citrate synthase [Leptospira levettii]
MSEKAILKVDGKEYELPIVAGSEDEKAIDITKLRQLSGYVTIDSGYLNTGACTSEITFLDGEKGILRYRGIPIEDLAAKSTFTEVAYLLIYGKLPNDAQLKEWNSSITKHTMIHEDLKRLFNGFPKDGHPMAIMSCMMGCLSTYYQDSYDPMNEEHREISIIRLLAKFPTIAAYAYKKSIGQPIIHPLNELDYASNFLNMMFAVPAEDYHIDPEIVSALNLLLILHADHEQNCSTSTVRLVGSSLANLYGAISAGILALWGPRHGGANQEVLEMLEGIKKSGLSVKKIVEQAKDKNSSFRLNGFGHRVYKNFDPRAKIIKVACDKVLNKLGIKDPLLDIAKELEEAALNDPYFVERKLYPNVDFYSGIIYRALGIPTNMFTVMFAMGRLPGWIAQWKEMIEDPNLKIGRPRQIYTGPKEISYETAKKQA